MPPPRVHDRDRERRISRHIGQLPRLRDAGMRAAVAAHVVRFVRKPNARWIRASRSAWPESGGDAPLVRVARGERSWVEFLWSADALPFRKGKEVIQHKTDGVRRHLERA